MSSAVKKWPNFSKLAMKWPIWQPWSRKVAPATSSISKPEWTPTRVLMNCENRSGAVVDFLRAGAIV